VNAWIGLSQATARAAADPALLRPSWSLGNGVESEAEKLGHLSKKNVVQNEIWYDLMFYIFFSGDIAIKKVNVSFKHLGLAIKTIYPLVN
jgi:hypothetical protein